LSEGIQKWREERKVKYPTKSRITEKVLHILNNFEGNGIRGQKRTRGMDSRGSEKERKILWKRQGRIVRQIYPQSDRKGNGLLDKCTPLMKSI